MKIITNQTIQGGKVTTNRSKQVRKMTKFHKRRSVAILLAGALVAAACGSGDGNNSSDTTVGASSESTEPATVETETVRFFKSNTWDAGTGAGFFSAIEEGYFAAENIEVKRVEALGAATAIAALASGSVDIAQSTPDAMMNGIAQGVDLVAVWAWLKPGIFGTLMAPGISSIPELAGKRVGIISRSSATWFELQLELANAKMSEADLTEVVALSCCAAQYTALRDNQVDAIGTWDGQYITLRQTAKADGQEEWFNSLTMKWNENYLSDVLITTRKYFEENEDVIVRFLRGFQAGMQFQIDNPEAAVANAGKSIEGLDPNNLDQMEVANARAASYQIDGRFDLELIKTSLAGYFSSKFITVDPKAFELERLFPPSVAEKVNGG